LPLVVSGRIDEYRRPFRCRRRSFGVLTRRL